MKRLRRRLLQILGGLATLVVALLIFVRLVYGGGDAYPDRTTDPIIDGDAVARVGELPFPAGNVTASAEGRVFVNIHPFTQSDRFTEAYLFEWADGELTPYPDQATQDDLRHVFGMTVDARERLWLTSPATLDRERTRLQAFDLATGERVEDFELDEGVGRFAQDIRVTPDGATMILADTGAFQFTSASLIVLDLGSKSARTILKGHESTQPQNWMIRTHEGDHTVGWGLVTFSVGVDGIALSPDGETLYYAPMSHDTLYRIPMSAVRDASLSEEALATEIEAVATKPLSDGIETTEDGEVLVTDIEHGAVVGIRPDGTSRTLVKLDSVSWTDGITVAPGGQVFFTDSAIPSYLDPLLRPPTRERLDSRAPHTALYQFQLPR